MMQELFSYFIRDQYCFDTLSILLPSPSISLIVYAHIPAAFITLTLGIFLIIQSTHQKIRIFFALAMAFFLYIITNLIIQLPFLGKDTTIMSQTALHLLEPIIMMLSLYFLYYLIKRKDAPFHYKIIGFMPLIPVFIVAFLGQNLLGYHAVLCKAVSNPYLSQYIFFVGASYLIVAIIFSISSIWKSQTARKERTVSSLGVCSFMLIFFMSQNLITGRIISQPLAYDYRIYFFFCMPLLIAFLAYLAIRFKVFRIRLVTSQIFLLSVFVLIVSQFFFLNNTISVILNTFLIFFMLMISHIVLSGVKDEVKTREHVEELALNLSSANQNLKKSNIKLEELNLQKTEFISIATHQLRGPLGSIKGYASLMLEGDFGPVDGKMRTAAETIMRSAQSLAVIVDDYLDVSRIEQGRMKYDFQVFDLKELVQSIVTDFTPIVSMTHLDLSFDYAKNEQFLTHADKGKIKQVITNLLDNSIKYTPAGTLHLTLERSVSDTGEKNILFAIKDTGVGIEPEVLPLLFARFSRAPDASKTNMLGTGLGLFVAKKIIEMHQGRIWAESEGRGKGSRFCVELKGE